MSVLIVLVMISFSVNSEENINEEKIMNTVPDYSVDAIAVYSKNTNTGDTDIYYSFYGHNPKIPKPVDTLLTWKWWTLNGEDVPSAKIPNFIVGNDSRPSIAFSREGFAVAVWDNIKQVGTVPCGDPPFPDPIYKSDILFSVWNGISWSDAAIVIEGANDIHLIDPSIAIDNNGNGIVTYTKEIIQRDQGCPLLANTIASVEYVKFQGSDKTFPAGGILEPPYTDPQMYYHNSPPSEVAFTSNLLIPDQFTRQQGVAVWWAKDTEYSKTCPADPEPYTIKIQTYWPKYGIWDGNSFVQKDFIPNKLIPPADLTNNLSIRMGMKLGISSNQFNHAKPVWDVVKRYGDPCNTFNTFEEFWSARWNSTNWQPKAAMFAFSNTLIVVSTSSFPY